jgi:hypothetical protein
LQEQSNVSSNVVQEIMHSTNVVFGVGVFEDVTCFEQMLFHLFI